MGYYHKTEGKMSIHVSKQKKHPISRFICGVVVVVMLVAGLWQALLAAEAKQKSFKSPEEAVQALVEAVMKDDTKGLMAIFGPESKDLIFSGDKVADNAGRDRFTAAYEEKHQLVKEGDNKAILIIGEHDWPMPIPLVKQGEAWLFNTEEGKDEIMNRRIGKNELNAIEVCLAYVDAQREYAIKDCDGNRLRDYAQRFASTRGKKDGLYWEVKEGEEESPMGPLMAKAAKKGYLQFNLSPYHGYYYKILKAQGDAAPGGAYIYVARGHMIGGFAMVAYPAEYGNSGIMTFVVNQDGVVYQKDLGKETKRVAEAMTLYDPDKTWQQVK
jgi:hypothetical protein